MAEEEKNGLSKATKLIAAITALLVALGTLVGAITVTLGGSEPPPYSYTVIHLGEGDGMVPYSEFLQNHPG